MKMTVIFHYEKKTLKSKMAILIYSPSSYCFVSPKNLDGEINRWIIEIKRCAIKKVLFSKSSKFTQSIALLLNARNFVEIWKVHALA